MNDIYPQRPGDAQFRVLMGALLVGFAAILFAVDISFPPGVLDGIGYPSLMLLTLWLPGRTPVIAAGVGFSLLTVLAYGMLPTGGIGEANIANRLFALVLVWLVAGLILHRKTMEARLNAALGLAENANAAKSRFLAHLSHELRTPLNAILGFADSLSLEIFGPLGSARNKESVRHIHGSAVTLQGLIADLLEFASLEEGSYAVEITPFALGPRLCRVIKESTPAAVNAQITIHAHVPETLPPMQGDARLVERTLRNLIGNALKFTPAGGWLDVRCGAAGGDIWIEIEDNGPGIAEETLRLVGQPFVRGADPATGNRGGAGLGLAVAKAFTEQQRGTLTLKSQAGFGTTVRLTYPAAHRGANTNAAHPVSPNAQLYGVFSAGADQPFRPNRAAM